MKIIYNIRFARKHLNLDDKGLVKCIFIRCVFDFKEIYINKNSWTNFSADFPYLLYEFMIDNLVNVDTFHFSKQRKSEEVH